MTERSEAKKREAKSQKSKLMIIRREASLRLAFLSEI